MSSNTRCSGLSRQRGYSTSLVWPARSPDLNPIENVWDALGRQVAGRNYPPANKNTLIRALTEEWDKLPQQLLDNVVQNLNRQWKTDEGILAQQSVNDLSQPRLLQKHALKKRLRAVGSLVVRASDPRPEGLGSMPDATKDHPSTRSTCSLNQWVCSLVGLFTSAGTGEYFPPLQFHTEIVEVVSPSIDPSGNLAELNRSVTCMVLKDNDRRTSSPMTR
ncbi:transposable element Tcb2 transposase [Trichonephila clavipes]|nr:transposable element Tcb2 transposase [Trichonephila clavipes]